MTVIFLFADDLSDTRLQLTEVNRRYHELEIELRRLENEREELTSAYKEAEAVSLKLFLPSPIEECVRHLMKMGFSTTQIYLVEIVQVKIEHVSDQNPLGVDHRENDDCVSETSLQGVVRAQVEFDVVKLTVHGSAQQSF